MMKTMRVWKLPTYRQPWVVNLSTLGRDNPNPNNPNPNPNLNPNPNPKICQLWVVTTHKGWRLIGGYFHTCISIWSSTRELTSDRC